MSSEHPAASTSSGPGSAPESRSGSKGSHPPNSGPDVSAAQDRERIIRVPVGQPIPEGYRFKQLLGQETGLAFGSQSNFTADVLLVEEVAA